MPPKLATHDSIHGVTASRPRAARLLPLRLRVNGEIHHCMVDPHTTLLACLRDQLGLASVQGGCEHGECGACTVSINGRHTNACLVLAACHQDDDITTLEGLGADDSLSPLQ